MQSCRSSWSKWCQQHRSLTSSARRQVKEPVRRCVQVCVWEEVFRSPGNGVFVVRGHLAANYLCKCGYISSLWTNHSATISASVLLRLRPQFIQLWYFSPFHCLLSWVIRSISWWKQSVLQSGHPLVFPPLFLVFCLPLPIAVLRTWLIIGIKECSLIRGMSWVL